MSDELFVFAGTEKNTARFRSENWTALLHASEDKLWRVLLHKGDCAPPEGLPVIHKAESCVKYEKKIGFSPAEVPSWEMRIEQTASGVILETDNMRAVVLLPDFRLEWHIRKGTDWLPLMHDRKTSAYNLNSSLGAGMYHYIARSRNDLHFGLGEKSGDVVKTNRRYRMCNIDCMGYDARHSDPLYKHFPYYMVKCKNGFYAVYYNTSEDCSIDLGNELDNYHGLYQYFHSGGEYLDYCVFGGHSMDEIVTAFSTLGGTPCLPPQWSLGYLASSMAYTDAPNAQELLDAFLEKCREENIPISGFHLSSGYTLSGSKRYVFNWDTSRFPNPKELFTRYAENGVRIIANIKPCLLTDHPLYAECAQENLFVRASDGTPLLSQFWDGLGSYLDFTNPKTAAWWENKVISRLLEYGVEATWNDNNEFEIWDERAKCAGLGGEASAHRLKPVLTLEMLRASTRAQLRHAPEKRPFLISRAGCHGMQQYVQTWSGDNLTHWNTLRYNHKMGLGMSLSGIYNFGHDVGGFAGGMPDAELFLRWVQHGIFMPRFSIHSWNDDGSVNEPWMHPEIMPQIRRLLVLRYRLIPYLYNLLYQSCREHKPIVCPVFYHFPSFEDYESDLYILGSDMLIANVFDSGVSQMTVTLPQGTGWYNLWSGKYFNGGEAVTCDVSFEQPVPVFMREGSVLLYNAGVHGFASKEAVSMQCMVFAPETGFVSSEFFIDDGESFNYHSGGFAMPRISVRTQGDELVIEVQNIGAMPLEGSLVITVIDRRNRGIRLQADSMTCYLAKEGEKSLWTID